MLSYYRVKLIIFAAFLAILLNGCGTVQPRIPSDSATAPAASGRQETPEPPPLSPPLEHADPIKEEPPQTVSSVPLLETREPAEIREIELDDDDIEFVRLRLAEYENKFARWLDFSAMELDAELAAELTMLETECMQKLEGLVSGYSLLLQTILQNDYVSFERMATVNPKKMQQLDISFLESRCGEILAMGMQPQQEFLPEAAPKPSFAAAQEGFVSLVEQGAYQEALSAYGFLARNYPGQEPSPATRLSYGIALQFTGQVEAAARHFNSMLDSGDLSLESLSLQRKIADLLLAGNDIPAAVSFYDSVISEHEALGAPRKWAEEQLAFLQSVEYGSEDMLAYIKLLREFQTSDYRIEAPRLNEAANAFVLQYAGSPVAASALRLKTFAKDQLYSWFNRQLVTIDLLVAEKKYTEATGILKAMTRYYLPAELQAVLQNTYYQVSLAEIQERETQRRIQEMELSQQWDTAANLLDSERYDFAIAAFAALEGTKYEEQAKIKITEAANQAAGKMRKEAASLFIRAGKTPDLEGKKELLLASHGLLHEILAKYPQTDLLEKVQQNIVILEEQMQKVDPALLEQLQQEEPAAQPADPPGPYTRQLQ